jgi:uncharacterized protein (DUF983 family)
VTTPARRHRFDTARAFRLIRRALLKRCPQCGGGKVFEGWFRMRQTCPTCGLQLERREQGYVVGAYMFNIAAAEGVWLAVMVGVTVATWPDPPWDLLLYGGAALMVVAPILFYPFAKTLFLAVDLAFRPPGPD